MRSEFIGCNFIIEYKIPDISTMVLLNSPQRIMEGMLNRTYLFYLNLIYFNQVPDHFGYETNTTLSIFKEEKLYLYYTEMDYIVYNTVYSPVGRYLYNDFEKLHNDININKCYTNNNVVYTIIK
jgi:hypothetical protein